MKILIAVPTFENISPETFKSIYYLYIGSHYVDFEYVKGYDCAKARNVIVSKTINGGYDYVLMVDSDIILPPNALNLFLEKPTDICFGLYPHKDSLGKSEVFKLGTDNYELRYSYKELDNCKEPRIKIMGAGFGCAFISTHALEELRYPYFKYVAYMNGGFLSEDLYFCDEARKKGFDIWADIRIRCGHLAKCLRYE